jgi:hypothetical protein
MNESAKTTAFNSRIETALKYLKISKDELDKILSEMGIDEPEIGLEILDAPTTTFDDFYGATAKIHAEGAAIPVPRLKLAWASLQLSKPVQVATPNADFATLAKTLRPIGQWSDLELLEAYGKESAAEVEEQLRKRSKGRNCIIFFDDGMVDTESSLYMIRKARYQETPSTFEIKGETKQVFKVGEFPLEVFYECPLHSNVLLIDGYCEECGMTHDIKNSKRLALLRIIADSTSDPARTYRELSFEQLSKEFPKAFVRYKDLEAEDKLPSLKRRISKSRDSDPFRTIQHKTY